MPARSQHPLEKSQFHFQATDPVSLLSPSPPSLPVSLNWWIDVVEVFLLLCLAVEHVEQPSPRDEEVVDGLVPSSQVLLSVPPT